MFRQFLLTRIPQGSNFLSRLKRSRKRNMFSFFFLSKYVSTNKTVDPHKHRAAPFVKLLDYHNSSSAVPLNSFLFKKIHKNGYIMHFS